MTFEEWAAPYWNLTDRAGALTAAREAWNAATAAERERAATVCEVMDMQFHRQDLPGYVLTEAAAQIRKGTP